MSRTDHHGAAGHNYEKGWGDHIEWDTPRSRILATVDHERVLIAEGLIERLVDEPRTCWDLGAEYEHECDVIALNLENAEILTGLAAMDSWEREYALPAGHENLLPHIPYPDGWADADEPDDEEPLAPWEHELLGMGGVFIDSDNTRRFPVGA